MVASAMSAKVETVEKKQYVKPLRKVETWNGEPPRNSSDNKSPMQFPISEKCGIKDEKLPKGKCDKSLIVIRVKNQKFEKDESGYGGQLQYDEKDIRQYKFCADHGPFPQGSESW